ALACAKLLQGGVPLHPYYDEEQTGPGFGRGFSLPTLCAMLRDMRALALASLVIVIPSVALADGWSTMVDRSEASGRATCLISKPGLYVALVKERNGRSAWNVGIGTDPLEGAIRYLKVGEAYFETAEDFWNHGDSGQIVLAIGRAATAAVE